MVDYSEIALVRGMNYLAESQAVTAHNLANVSANGFKRRIAIAESQEFDSLLNSNLPTVSFGQRTDWTNGSVTTTGERLHLALEGPGFFRVQAENGQKFYTRNGALLIDQQGRLANSQGHVVLDPNDQPISFADAPNMDRTKLRISPDGTVESEGAVFGQVGVFNGPSRLDPTGQALFADRYGERPVPTTASAIRQGNLEQSNVDSLNELVRMISIQRSFQATSRALTTLGRIKTSFVNAVAR